MAQRLYNDYSSYLKAKYGCKVYRIGIDAGFSCPNRDGTKSEGGCIYCNVEGSRASYINPKTSIGSQIDTRIKYLKERFSATKAIAYFQAFTNTYGSLDRLKKTYDEVLPFKEIVGISIGTRPDTIDRDKLNLIASYKDRYDVWIEYGLQSAHDKTLAAINRGHTFKEFADALVLTKNFNIPVCAHAIIGLPGESKEDIIETARALSALKIDGVKIHLLHVLKGSGLEKMHREGTVKLLEQEEYIQLVCDFLEHLSPSIIVQRLTGEGTMRDHIAPAWALDKIGTITKIAETLKARKTRQGVKS